MKNIICNTGYFLKEVKTLIQLNLLSNILSVFSTGLIFFILAMVISGWWVSSQVVEVIQGEAEINVYFDENIGAVDELQLVERIQGIDGVQEARVVDEGEAYYRMEEILGKDARVLELLDDNPFESYIEVKIQLEKMEPVIRKLELMTEIEYVRDNREVLDRLRNIAGVLRFLGYLVVTAVGISTLVIISHSIRTGIYNNREQINTLRLLGAPETFIAFPFIVEGVLLTLGGGMLAATLAAFMLKLVYVQMLGPLPFIPLPPREILVRDMIVLTISMSAIMGILGSLFGLSSEKSTK